jgi:hypothetical protein
MASSRAAQRVRPPGVAGAWRRLPSWARGLVSQPALLILVERCCAVLSSCSRRFRSPCRPRGDSGRSQGTVRAAAAGTRACSRGQHGQHGQHGQATRFEPAGPTARLARDASGDHRPDREWGTTGARGASDARASGTATREAAESRAFSELAKCPTRSSLALSGAAHAAASPEGHDRATRPRSKRGARPHGRIYRWR